MAPTPVFLSPALPSELLTYILDHLSYPTTIIICSPRTEFVAALQEELLERENSEINPQIHSSIPASILDEEPQSAARSDSKAKHRTSVEQLVSQTLANLAISRHIRTIYVPTVNHLRSYMPVFSPGNTKIHAPPATFMSSVENNPTFVIYGMIEMHRETSEWSAQGLSTTTAALAELADRLGWELLMTEPRKRQILESNEDDEIHEDRQVHDSFEALLKEEIPILTGSARRADLESEDGAWSNRTVELGRIMSRWVKYQTGVWDSNHDSQENN